MTQIDARLTLDGVLAVSPVRRWAFVTERVPPPDRESILLALGDEAEAISNAELRHGIEASKAIVALADESGLPIVQARSRRALSAALAQSGQFDEALEVSKAAFAFADAAGATIEAARARLAASQPHANLGRFEDAVAAGTDALNMLMAAGAPELAARAHLNLGATWDMRDRPERALFHYDQARGALSPDSLLLAQIESNRGTALMAMDRFAESETAFGVAVTGFEAGEFGWGAAVAEGNLAYLAMRQGQLSRCLYHFERARRFFELDEASADLARLDAEQADALGTLGMPADALAAYERALPALESQGLHVEAALSRLGFARVLRHLGRLADAKAVLATAEPVLRSADQTTALARLAALRAEIALGSGDLEQARRDIATARAGLADLPVQTALVAAIEAHIAIASGDPSAARRILHDALPPIERAGIAPVIGEISQLLGEIELADGNQDAAYNAFRRAVEEIERVRGTLQAEHLRSAFQGDRLGPYEHLFTLALHRPDGAAEAFATAEQARSRALLDTLGTAAVPHVTPPAATRTELSLTHELESHQAWLNWYYSQIAAGDKPGAHQRAERAEREQALASLSTRLAVSGGAASLFAPPIDLAETQLLLPDGATLISYMIARGNLHAIAVRRDGAQAFSNFAPAAVLDDAVQRLHFQLYRALMGRTSRRQSRLLDDCRRELASLDSLVLAPLKSAIGSDDQLIFVPFGSLHAVPFAALWDGEAYLVERHTTLTAPSASVLKTLDARAGAPEDGSPLVVGVPDEQAPNMGREATSIAATLPGARTMVGASATADWLLDTAPSASLLHLACHGRFLPDAPQASGLRLADRWLTAHELYRLRTNASLVTLSGCETGKSLVTTGDELVGLVRAMLAAGAGSLLVSLWMTHDDVATSIMSLFYRQLRTGSPRPSALRHAQLAALAEHPHPAYWAPFTLIDRPFQRSA